MAALPYFPFYPQDWLSDPDVGAMTHAQRGVYIDLLARMWVAGHGRCDLPDDNAAIARLLGMPTREWVRIRPALESVLLIQEGRISNPKLTSLFEKAEQLSQTNSANGSRGGRPRKGAADNEGKTDDNRSVSDAKAGALRPQSERETETKTISESEVNVNPPIPPPRGQRVRRRVRKADAPYSEMFEQFWQLYPRQVDKRGAWEKWQDRVAEGVTEAQLVVTAAHYAQAMAAEGRPAGKMLHAATFLGHTKKYEDYIRAPGPARGAEQASRSPAHREMNRDE